MCSSCFTGVDAVDYGDSDDIPKATNPTTINPAPTEPIPTEPIPTAYPSAPTEPMPEPEPSEPAEPPKQEPEPTVPPKNDTPNTTRYYDVPLSNDLQKYIFKLCKQHDIDPALVIAMIKQESNYKSGCIGDNGDALGLMQVQPKWHQGRMDRLGCPDLLDPYQNVKVGIDFLAELYGRGKPTEWVLMAYNGGAAYANRNWNNGVVSNYATKVLKIRDNLEFKD